MSGINIAVVGAGFGRDFLPVYRSHPDVGRVAICDANRAVCDEVGDRFGVADRFTDLEVLLADDTWDAVHIATPVRFHVDHAVAVLRSGKHCACAVPMATTLDGIRAILDAQEASGATYMMMETMVFGREYLYVAGRHERGELGPLTFLRGDHIQNLDGYPWYWYGYPPMTYSTHALSPLLALAGARVTRAHGLGSGRLTPDRTGEFDNPYPVESALFALDRDGLAAQVTASFFQTGRAYYEGFSVYGQDRGVEWPQTGQEEGPLTVFTLDPKPRGRGDGRGRPVEIERVEAPDRADLLPAAIAPFTRRTSFDPGTGVAAVPAGGGHGGSHPHLVHEFVSSLVEGRRPAVDAVTAATWTAPGICGHASAMRNGEPVDVPDYAEVVGGIGG